MSELQAGSDGEACEIYRLSATKALDIVQMRNEWCIKRLDDRHQPAPSQCLLAAATPTAQEVLSEIGWDPVEAMLQARWPERKAAIAAATAELLR